MIKRVLLYFALLLWFVVPVTAQPTIFIEDTEVEAGESVELAVGANDFENIVSLQFSVNWDTDFLTFDSVSLAGVEALPEYFIGANFGTNNSSMGRITTFWVDPALLGFDLTDSTTIFKLHFTVLGAPGDSTQVEITGNPTSNEFSDGDGNTFEALVESGTVKVMDVNSVQNLLVQTNGEFTLYQNEPNPFDNHTVIRFDVHKASDFVLEIHNAEGKLVYTKETFFSTGNQSIVIERNMLPAAGVYFYKLKTIDNFFTNRMILVR